MEIELFIPASVVTGRNPLFGIEPGSAICGTWINDLVGFDCYYEGNLHGSESMRTYADRALHAAGRMTTKYPTIARRLIRADAIELLGTFDPTFGEVQLSGRPGRQALAAWLGIDEADVDPELVTSGGRAQDLRTARAWSPAQRQQLRFLPPAQRAHYEKAGLI